MCQNYYDDSKSGNVAAAARDAATSKKENIFAAGVFIIP